MSSSAINTTYIVEKHVPCWGLWKNMKEPERSTNSSWEADGINEYKWIQINTQDAIILTLRLYANFVPSVELGLQLCLL